MNNDMNQTNNNQNSQSQNKTILIIVIVVVVALVLGLLIFNKSQNNSNISNNNTNNNSNNENSSNTDNENMPVYMSVTADTLKDNIGTDYYKQFLGKKITITNFTLEKTDDTDTSFHTNGLAFVSVYCDNITPKNYSTGQVINITGVVKQDDWSTSNLIYMTNCSIN